MTPRDTSRKLDGAASIGTESWKRHDGPASGTCLWNKMPATVRHLIVYGSATKISKRCFEVSVRHINKVPHLSVPPKINGGEQPSRPGMAFVASSRCVRREPCWARRHSTFR